MYILSDILLQETHFPILNTKCDGDSCTNDELNFEKGDQMKEGLLFPQSKETGKQNCTSDTSMDVCQNLDAKT